ncbi:TPA: sugar dehydrogenase complex small subunit [Burkholderia cenocepacia]|uniref:sugar dehydrogenase complex small subunit n=1 Tax=Burkholderia cenocepacia TaxID=95486 RepID=UPI0019073E72|nr:sugar dehydrogenase complex small subunit [Burkholderia cenocepacia]MBJ9915832.1 uridylyltransferase [Burkholderia cenocepacia]MBR8116695.1 uridylyltransferase [Burkholderia cenocepacia]MBR8370874.1 uridylyltransferase [Burkholderia cenocepacia]MBR8381992.1 uridylyltransferase [Burkholderia cenocepacia]MBR8439364.1 uridylyltransferase [Burkholderia cenocepacia]
MNDFDVSGAPDVQRRRLVKLSAGAALAAALPAGMLIARAATAPQAVPLRDFAGVAAYLTRRSALPSRYVQSVYDGLVEQDREFPARLRALAVAIGTGTQPVDRFVRKLGVAAPELRATALAIIEAFYTGSVGHGGQARMVGYETALMFEPTSDVTVIPTYIRARPEYWTARPAADAG